MRTTSYLFYFSIVIIFFPLGVFADTVKINISGRLISSPCTVDAGNSNLSPSLGSIQAAKLNVAGGVSDEVSFKITLKDCPPLTKRVILTFSGDVYDGNVTAFANKGTANNVGVQIKRTPDSWAANPIRPGASFTEYLVLTNNATEIGFVTRAYTEKGNVSPGTVKSSATISFVYQ